MKSKASSPAKVILFGEHFVVYGVKAILCAIDKRITVTAETIEEDKISIRSKMGELELEPGKEISEINSPLKPFYYLANKFMNNQKKGIQIYVESDIPPGVGLGSSSACCVAGAAAISKLFKKTSKEEILELAIKAEKTVFEDTSGADCTVCTYGGIMEYDKKNGFNKIKFKPDFHLVIANSNMVHSTKSVVEDVRRFKEEDERAFSVLCDKESKLVENVSKLLKEDDIKKLGKKVTENQGYLETIGVSNDKLREMIQASEDKSFGAKITGAGRGGCIFALTDESNLEETINGLEQADYDCFSAKIDFNGLDTF